MSRKCLLDCFSMAYMALYRAYRPQAFKEVSGQEHIVRTILNAIINNKVAHAYLFSGPRGTGKTTIAKIMAKAINCPNCKDGEPCNECEICKGITKGMISDVVEIDAASNNGVDEIRDIRDKVKYLPSEGKYKVYIIDEVHMLSTGAFNALLKTLEEPPAHAIFILATTEPHKIPATILSRCQRFDFRGVGNKEIISRINFIAKEENIKIADEAIELIAECAEGGMRDALSLLDEAISFAGDMVKVEDVYQVSGAVNLDNMLDVAECILDKDSGKVLTALEKIIDLGKEIPKICNDLISFYRDMLIYKNNPKGEKALYNNKDFIKLAKKTSNQKIYFYLNVLNEAQNNMKFTNQKRTYLELALVKMSDYLEQISVDNSSMISELEAKIAQLEARINNLGTAPIKEIAPTIDTPVVQKRNTDFNYIEISMIENVLNNGNVSKKKILINKLAQIKSNKKDRLVSANLEEASVVACSGDECIITFNQIFLCDFMMQKENRNKVLSLINSDEKLITNYYAIPTNVWDMILQDYTTKFKSGIRKPQLAHINIDVRLYNEEQVQESEMAKLAHDFFGNNVSFE